MTFDADVADPVASTHEPLTEKLAPLAHLFERALAQWLQAWGALMLGSTFFEDFDVSTPTAAAIATIPAAITVLVNSVTNAVIPVHWPWYVQVVLRTLRSGASAFGGFLIALPHFDVNLTVGKSALAAALLAVGSALKAELARFIGNPTSTAWLPRAVDPLPSDAPRAGMEIDGYDPYDDNADPVEPGEWPAWSEGEPVPPTDEASYPPPENPQNP